MRLHELLNRVDRPGINPIPVPLVRILRHWGRSNQTAIGPPAAHFTFHSEHQEGNQCHNEIKNENCFHMGSQNGLRRRARNAARSLPKGQSRSVLQERCGAFPGKTTDDCMAMSLMRNVDVHQGFAARFRSRSPFCRRPADGRGNFPQTASRSVLKFSGRDA